VEGRLAEGDDLVVDLDLSDHPGSAN
jgi:hypothetical protein